MSKTELKKLIKTELAIVQVTTDNKKFLNEYKAIIHESELEDIRKQDRRWNNEFQQAIKTQIDRESERNNGCQENQARDLPIDNESLDGTKMTLNDTNE